MSDTSIEPPPMIIDWATVIENVECPLCLYNLRGLSEPRCPECGYRFEWAEVLNPQNSAHRYVFEHHHRRNIWSFYRTLRAGLRTRRFWSTLRAVHTVNVKRLVIYWLLCGCFLIMVPATHYLRIGLPLAEYNASVRSRMSPNAGKYQGISQQQFFNQYLPLPPHPEFFRQLSTRVRTEEIWSPVKATLFTLIAWPWLTFAALMIFRVSMRKAKVQRSHVLRCVIYSADAGVWYVLLTFLVAAMTMVIVIASAGRISHSSQRGLPAVLMLLLWVVWLDRLASAYRLYLQFDHPFLTALASQVLVALAMMLLLLWAHLLI